LDRELFRLLQMPDIEPRYNVAPTQDAAVVRQAARAGERSLDFLRWGLIPHWAKDFTIGSRMINARAETVDRKPAFELAFRTQRCLVPVDGFYEWKKLGRIKQPYFIRMRDGRPFALAGLWDRWSDAGHDSIESFTVLTTTPNALVEPIHNRMPVILSPTHYDTWLDPAVSDAARLRPLLQPFPADTMTGYPVSRHVNSSAHEGPECVIPIEP
jgi:putative SOS response-associated peptidase YedK